MNSSPLRIGIFSWFGFVLPLPERLKLIKKAGFDATTLWWEDEIGCPGIEKENMPKMVRESGLVLENIHVPYDDCNDIWSDVRSVRDAVVKRHLNWLEDCARFDIPLMVMHITDGPNPPFSPRNGIDSITRILNTAEEAGIVIAIENTERLDYTEFVLSEIESPYLGLCYDSSHDWLYDGVGAEILLKLGRYLKATHLSDNDGKKDRHWLPGEGIIDWNRVSRFFPNSTYDGFLTLEVCPGQEDLNQSPYNFLSKAYQQALWLEELLKSG
ncbi:MAG: sugar phosphate isomerase/epimerase family protein [Syntrophothermaceae bacterium]